MLDYLWENFGLIEWLLCLELVLLLTASFFYQVAKVIARTDRHDPLVRFYRVFWQAFFSRVSSFADIELKQAEAAAFAAGIATPSDLDAPNLGALGEGDLPPAVGSELEQQNAQPARGAPAPRQSGAARGATVEAAVSATFDAIINPLTDRDAIVGLRDGNLVVDVQCAPEDGHANGVIITQVAQRIGVPAYQITVIRGHYKLLKTFRVQQIDQPTLNARLQRLG